MFISGRLIVHAPAAVEEYEATLTAAVTSSKSAASDHHELLESLSVEVEAMRVEQSGLVEAASRSDAERSAIAADYAVLVRERQAESQVRFHIIRNARI